MAVFNLEDVGVVLMVYVVASVGATLQLPHLFLDGLRFFLAPSEANVAALNPPQHKRRKAGSASAPKPLPPPAERLRKLQLQTQTLRTGALVQLPFWDAFSHLVLFTLSGLGAQVYTTVYHCLADAPTRPRLLAVRHLPLSTLVVALNALLYSNYILFQQGGGAELRISVGVFVAAFSLALGIQVAGEGGRDAGPGAALTGAEAAFRASPEAVKAATQHLSERVGAFLGLWVAGDVAEGATPNDFTVSQAFAELQAPTILVTAAPYVIALVCATISMCCVLPAVRFGSTFLDLWGAAPLAQRIFASADLACVILLPMIPLLPADILFRSLPGYTPYRWACACDVLLLLGIVVRLFALRAHVQSFLVGVVKSARSYLRTPEVDPDSLQRHFIVRLTSIPLTAVQFVGMPLILLALLMETHSIGHHLVVRSPDTTLQPVLISVPPPLCTAFRDALHERDLYGPMPPYRRSLSHDAFFAAGSWEVDSRTLEGFPGDVWDERDLGVQQVLDAAKYQEEIPVFLRAMMARVWVSPASSEATFRFLMQWTNVSWVLFFLVALAYQRVAKEKEEERLLQPLIRKTLRYDRSTAKTEKAASGKKGKKGKKA